MLENDELAIGCAVVHIADTINSLFFPVRMKQDTAVNVKLKSTREGKHEMFWKHDSNKTMEAVISTVKKQSTKNTDAYILNHLKNIKRLKTNTKLPKRPRS